MMNSRKELYAAIKANHLFKNIPEETFESVLLGLHAHTRSYSRGDTIQNIGDSTVRAGIVIRGHIHVDFYDEDTNTVNIHKFGPGDMFGAAFVCAGVPASPMHIYAVSEAEVLFLDLQAVLQADNPFDGRDQLMAGLIREFSGIAVFLNRKIRIMGQKRLRDRLKLFLQSLDYDEKGQTVLPFNQTELAEYLGANRSSLARELSRMKEEGILTWKGRRVTLKERSFLK